MKRRKLLVMGLDCAPPEIVFGKLGEQLPNLHRLMGQSVYGRMRSCDPPITIPAWMVMVTSKNPGRLGLYGFRHRRGYSYHDGWIANSLSVKEEKLWDILGRAGMKSCLVGIPPSYPPTPVNGTLVSCFITPDPNRQYTYPPELKKEIEALVGPYPFDVEFRTDSRDALLKDLCDMTDKHFKTVEHLLSTRQWDFFMFVEIGTDRMHHAFWKFYDVQHPKYVEGNPYENAMSDYYKRLDVQIGRILQMLDDDTVVAVVSDHGAKGMRGAFCANEWLIHEGYLVLKEQPQTVTEIEKASVDWSRTKAWAWGGYYARIFFNVKGREPEGIIDPKQFEHERDELTRRLKQIKDPAGRKMDTQVYKPEELYPVVLGDSPDLMVYFDNLYWRSAGTLGHGALYLSENDTGPDDAVHSQYGIFILHDKQLKQTGPIPDVSILDIAPTLLQRLNITIPSAMEGKPLPLDAIRR